MQNKNTEKKGNKKMTPKGTTEVTFFNSLLKKLKTTFKTEKNSATVEDTTPTNTERKSALLNQEFLSNFESFSSKTVEDVMVPRSDIVAVSKEIGLDELNRTIVEHNHTRTLVYDENLDKIIGFIHIKDLFQILTESKKFNLKGLLRKHLVSPISMRLTDLLTEMQVKRTHIAVVVDEYGGTDGIVTIEDIMEAIVGRIDDEHDDDIDPDSFKILKSGTVISSARVTVSELEGALKIKLKTEEDEFDTIGGLVLSKSGSIPTKGEIVEIADDIAVEILDSTPRTIKQLKIMFNAKNSSNKDQSK